MFPDFMNDMLAQARCGHCNTPQTVADIQIVGVHRPEEFEAFYGEPVFLIVIGCSNCHQWTNYTMRRPRTESVEGVVSFIKLIEAECEGKSPPLNIPGLGKKSKTAPATSGSSPDATQRASNAADKSQPRPSIRDNHPDTPPTQREIQHFLNRLRSASFKSGSTGFGRWMKEFGGDDSTGNAETT